MEEAPARTKTTGFYKKANSYSAKYYESSEPVGFKPFADNSEVKGFSI